MSEPVSAAHAAVADAALLWGNYAVEIAAIRSGLHASWQGHSAAATDAELARAGAHIDALCMTLAFLAETLAVEGAAFADAVIGDDNAAAHRADEALCAQLALAAPSLQWRSHLEGPAVAAAPVGPLPPPDGVATRDDAATSADAATEIGRAHV